MEDTKIRASRYLEDYIKQMRSSGFNDYYIRKNLVGKSVSIPNELPEGFGGETWGAGMKEEFKQTKPRIKGGQVDYANLAPSPNEYREYEPGNTPARLPTYKEFSGSGLNGGGWENTRRNNLLNSLQNYNTNYQGPRVGASQYGYEAGIVGLPQGVGQQYYQEFLEIAKEKADIIKQGEDIISLRKQFPEAGIMPEDTMDVALQKVEEYSKADETRNPSIATALDDAVYQATLAGEPVTIEDVISTGLQLGYELSFDEAKSIFQSATDRAMRGVQ